MAARGLADRSITRGKDERRVRREMIEEAELGDGVVAERAVVLEVLEHCQVREDADVW
jgi:hypothetical protein